MFENNLIPGSKFTTKIIQLRQQNFDFGLNEYPIFDENYRQILNNKILDHYNFNEIGFETAGQFRLFLKARMNEIMPLYNQKYLSEKLKFDPFESVNYTENVSRETTGNSTGESTSNSQANANGNSKHIFQDTPQGNIVNLGIDEQTHATSLDLNKSNTESSANDTTNTKSNISNMESYLRTIQGNNGASNFSNLLIDFRKTFLNIDMEIINELQDLFMGLWK